MNIKNILFCSALLFTLTLSGCNNNPSSSFDEKLFINEKVKNVLDFVANSNNVLMEQNIDNLDVNILSTRKSETKNTTNEYNVGFVGKFVNNIHGLLIHESNNVEASVEYENISVDFSTDLLGDMKTSSGTNLSGATYFKNTNLYLTYSDNTIDFVQDSLDIFLGDLLSPELDVSNKIYLSNALTDSMLPILPSMRIYYDYVDIYTSNLKQYENCIDLVINGDDINLNFDLQFDDVVNLLYGLEENKDKDKEDFRLEMSNKLTVNKLIGTIVSNLSEDKIEFAFDFDITTKVDSENSINTRHIITKGNNSLIFKKYDINFPQDLDSYQNILGE